jgi:hypothetical protein
MIIVGFSLGNQAGVIKIDGSNIQYGKMFRGTCIWMPIEKLRLDYNGIIKEFPDLKDKQEIEAREIASQRLKNHLKSLKNEDEVYDYVIKELKKFGAIPRLKQKKGVRPEKLD